MIKNKKAGMFGALMVLSMIVFMATAWFAFSKTNEKINGSFNITALKNYYYEQDKFSFYMKESSRLSASQAFSEISKQAGINLTTKCNTYKNYIIWNENCFPDNLFIQQKFLEEYNKSFHNYINNYPNKEFIVDFIHNFEDNKITSEGKKITLTTAKKSSFAVYNFSYEIIPKSNFDLASEKINLNNFREIYNIVINEKEKCSNEISCLKNNVVLNDWNVEIEKENNYILFNFSTKKFFFYENAEKFAPIAMNIALMQNNNI